MTSMLRISNGSETGPVRSLQKARLPTDLPSALQIAWTCRLKRDSISDGRALHLPTRLLPGIFDTKINTHKEEASGELHRRGLRTYTQSQ